MTQDEYNAALESGAAKVEAPETAPASEPSGSAQTPASSNSSASLDMEQFISILVALQSTQKYLSSAPTFIPQTFQDQVQFVFDGTNYSVYFYFNNQWNNIGAASGGASDASLSMSDITTNDVSITKHGFAPKLPNNATEYLNGVGTYSTPTDAGIVTSDITTNNVSISKHGFAPKAPNDATKYLDGTGAWSTPSGSGSSQRQEFSASGTFTAPGGVSTVYVTLIAGGGGGGASLQNATGRSGGGGGGAGFLCRRPSPVTAGNTYAVTVGGGGAGGQTSAANGTNGSNTSFVDDVSTTTVTAGSGGIGGTASAAGGAAGAPFGVAGTAAGIQTPGGNGGASFAGLGSLAHPSPGSASAADNATGAGSGGAGGTVWSSSGSGFEKGGDGAGGIVIIEW